MLSVIIMLNANPLKLILLNVVMLSCIMFSPIVLSANMHSFIMLSAVLLRVFMQNGIRLNVLAPPILPCLNDDQTIRWFERDPPGSWWHRVLVDDWL